MKWHLKHARHGTRPWDVQAEALRRSNGARGYGYFLQQGLGKTALAQNEFIDQDDTDIHLVLAPNSFKMDWVLAPDEWGVGWMPSGMWPHQPVPHDDAYMQYAVNYESARDGQAMTQLVKLCERRSVMLTIDESTALKTHNSKTTRAVIEMAKRARKVRLLNGTPLTQTPMDYYGQLRAIGELNGTSATEFRNRYAVKGGFMGRQILHEIRNEEELGRLLDDCTFRALKADWRKDLPPKQYTTVHTEMTDRMREHYGTMMDEFFVLLGDGTEVTASMVLTQYDKLRQISSCVLKKDDQWFMLEEPRNNPKLNATLDIINGCPGKVIVVYFYRASGELLLDRFTRMKLNPAFIRGQMKPFDLIEQKRKFNDDPSCRVIVCQIDAAFRGHTLIGQKGLRERCSTTIFYENHFGFYQRDQMEDRNHRGEQDQNCDVFDIATSPMDELTVQVLTAKKDMATSMDEVVAKIRSIRR